MAGRTALSGAADAIYCMGVCCMATACQRPSRFTNTRIFHVNRLIQLAVFPWGMDYHLPHHLFPMVPHFRLRQLHALLSESDEYREHATVVDGYFLPRERPPQHPTVLDLMASPLNHN